MALVLLNVGVYLGFPNSALADGDEPEDGLCVAVAESEMMVSSLQSDERLCKCESTDGSIKNCTVGLVGTQDCRDLAPHICTSESFQ